MKTGNRRIAQPPALPRRDWVRVLPRHAVRWDVLFHELALALLRRYWHSQGSFKAATLRLENEEIGNAAMLLALTVRQAMTQAARRCLHDGVPVAPWDASASAVDALVASLQRPLREMICNYCEIGGDGWIRRDHTDLLWLMPRLQETVRQFLLTRCAPGGELRPCIEAPGESDEGYFPNLLEKPAWQGTGDALRDVVQLEVLLTDGDDHQAVKEALMQFVQAHPLLAPEQGAHIVRRLQECAGKEHDTQVQAAYGVASDYVFNPTRQGGRTPIELFIEEQPELREVDRQRLLRWQNETVAGIFTVIACGRDQIELEDVSDGRRYTVSGPEVAVFSEHGTGMALLSRLVPWDQEWKFTGIQRVLEVTVKDKARLAAENSPLKHRRPTDENHPSVRRLRELTRLAHDQWLQLFGDEVVVSQDIEAPLAKWYQHLHEAKCVPGGHTLAEAALEIGLAAPQLPAAVEEQGQPASVALIFDKDFGLTEAPEWAAVRQAIESRAPLTPEERSHVFMYLSAPWLPTWCCRQVLTPRDTRLEAELRSILGDEDFSIERDFEPLLGHFRPLDWRLPNRPRLWL
jgi:hypothetical protein